MAHKIWRDDEGTPWQGAEGASPTAGSAEPEIWRFDEGAPWTDGASRHAPGREADRGRRPRSRSSPRTRRREKVYLPPAIGHWRHRRQVRRARARHHGRSRTRRILLAGAVVALGLVLLGADALYVGLGLAERLPRAAAALETGADRFGSGKIDEARAELQDAADAARDSLARMDHPSFALAARLPWLRDDAAAMRALAGAADLSSRAGLRATEVASILGWGEQGLASAIYEDGRVDLTAVAEVQSQVADAANLLAEADEILGSAPDPGIGMIVAALEKGRARIADASGSAAKGAALFDALPGMLGADGERRYLLAFQALGEARATGGVVGLYGVLEAEAGRIKLVHIGPHKELKVNRLRGSLVPRWYGRSYGPQFALRQWTQANVSPNFPVVAGVLGEMYESATGEEVDGVVAMDPITMEQLMGAMDPISHEGRTITTDNVAKVLLEDSYLDFLDQDTQNDFLAGVVRSFWDEVKAGDVRPEAFATGLGEAARTGHLKLAMEEEELQSTVQRLGVTGDYSSLGDNVQMVFHNNYGVNKVDYYLRRKIHTKINLTEAGDALVTTAVTMKNAGPSGPPSLLLGPGVEGDLPGLNRMTVNFLLPVGAEPRSLAISGQTDSRGLLAYADADYPVVWDVIEIAPQETTTATITYRLGDAVRKTENGSSFQLVLNPQVLAFADHFSVTVRAPQGNLLRDVAEDPSTIGQQQIELSGILDEAKSINIAVEDS